MTADLIPDPLGESDIPALLDLTASIEWDFTAADFHTMLASGKMFGHRTPSGGLASAAAIFPYGDRFASAGAVMVSPHHRRQGLGRAVMLRCFDALPHPLPPVMLIATPEGERLYATLGFRTIDHVHKLIAGRPPAPIGIALPDSHSLGPLGPADRDAVRRVDRRAFGADRGRFLAARIAQARTGGVLRRADGAVVGYGLAVPQHDLLVIGPVVAPDGDMAAALIAHLGADAAGPVRIDVPAEHRLLWQALPGWGFEPIDVPPVMLLGGDRLPGDRETLFAIASQAFG